MTVINTNVKSLVAQNAIAGNARNLATAMERLSTGSRVNSSKDDAAGLAIGTRMTANIRGLSAAIRNANDGISLTQTAEGSLGQISDNLQRIRELAVQSANAGNNSTDRTALNNEATQLIAEIDRVASNTAFNGIKLIDGTFQAQSLQIGAGNDSNDRLSVSIGSAKSSALGVGSSSSYAASKTGTNAVAASALAAGDLTINGYEVGASVSDGVSNTNSTFSGLSKANAINAISGSSGVTASVAATTATGLGAASTFIALVAGDLTINGVDVGATAAGGTAIGQGAVVAAAINNVTGQTGVTATFAVATGIVSLNAADGRNITVTTTTAGATGSGLGITAGLTAGTVEAKSIITLSSTSSAGISLAGTAGLTSVTLATGYTAATATAGAGVSSLDLTTVAGSQAALTTLDSAINTITDSRASMGAYQNRLTSAIGNLETTSMNMSASRSRIMDTDYAAETTNLAKAQIISQAATAMLAQANQSGQSVLALLQ
jgi:flagellin